VKPGERIRAIQDCSRRLALRPWGEAQLALQQFGFQTWDARDIDDLSAADYFIQQLSEGPGDVALVDLLEFLQARTLHHRRCTTSHGARCP
jgi:hypothetical protein